MDKPTFNTLGDLRRWVASLEGISDETPVVTSGVSSGRLRKEFNSLDPMWEKAYQMPVNGFLGLDNLFIALDEVKEGDDMSQYALVDVISL